MMDLSAVETHFLLPFLPENAKLLMLGSFPPPKTRWKMNFYYPNLHNDMWRIFGTVFFDNKDYFVNTAEKSFREQRIRDFLMEQGIAIADVARTVVRLQGNAADKFLHIVETVNLPEVLQHIPKAQFMMTTGDKATETLLSLLSLDGQKIDIGTYIETDYLSRHWRVYRMPSSSRAYPLPLAQKAAIYRRFFMEIGLLKN